MRSRPDAFIDLVADDADDGVRLHHARFRTAQIQFCAKRIFCAEHLFCQRLVDRDHKWRIRGVIVIDHASANHGRAHQLCIASAHGRDLSIIVVLAIVRLADDSETGAQVDVYQGQSRIKRGPLYTGNARRRSRTGCRLEPRRKEARDRYLPKRPCC